MNLPALRCMAAMLAREAWAERAPLHFLGGLLCIFGLAAFAGELAGAERAAFECALLAPVLRIYALAFLLLFVAGQLDREWQAQRHEMWLSLPLSATEYWLGKFIGYAWLVGLGLLLALPPLLCFAPAAASVTWLSSLYLESWMVIACAMFCAMGRRGVLLACGFAAGFWLLARHAQLFLDISSGGLLADGFLRGVGAGRLLAGIEWILPDLHLFTRTEWLAYPDRFQPALLPLCIEASLCVAALAIAGLWELARNHA